MKSLTVYSDEELKQIQKLELDTLKIIKAICEKENIEFFLCGGTALGAVRHNGFIPWDDDIDIGMTRENYRRFLECAPKLLPHGYQLQTPYSDRHAPYFYSKVRIDGTKFIEYCNHRVKMHHGVYVDVFPFDEVPDDENENKKQFDKVRRLIRIFTLRQSPDVSMEPETPKEHIIAAVRYLTHLVAKLVPYRLLSNKLEKEITKYNGTGQSGYNCLNYPVRNGELILKKDLYPLRKRRFADTEMYIANNFDAHLTTHYGDYMQLPPPEQRFGHKPYYVSLNIDNQE